MRDGVPGQKWRKKLLTSPPVRYTFEKAIHIGQAALCEFARHSVSIPHPNLGEGSEVDVPVRFANPLEMGLRD
jgi:hypothetical protein